MIPSTFDDFFDDKETRETRLRLSADDSPSNARRIGEMQTVANRDVGTPMNTVTPSSESSPATPSLPMMFITANT